MAWRSALALAVALAAGSAHPQNLPALDVERLTLDPAARGSLVVGSGKVAPAGTARMSIALGYERQPFVLVGGRERGHGIGSDSHDVDIVGSRLTVFGGLAYSVTDFLELDVRVPYAAFQRSDDAQLVARGIGVPTDHGAASPSLGAKLAVVSQDGDAPFSVALALDVTPDWGSQVALAGNDGTVLKPSLEASHAFGDGWLVAAEAGGILRTRTVRIPSPAGAEELRSEVAAGLAVSKQLAPFAVELSGRGAWNVDSLGHYYELLAGGRWAFGHAELFALAGPGFGESPGTPQYRALIGFALEIEPARPPPPPPAAAPPPPPPPPPPPKPPDPCAPGQEHSPRQCPDLDDDGDGVPNGQDMCPLVKGLRELSGCPDSDTDADGVPDRLDKCPNEPGIAEYRGCPPPRSAALQEGGGVKKISIAEAIYFDSGKATIQGRSNPVLNDVAAVLEAHPEIEKVVVKGHTDGVGGKKKNQELSQARAESVRDYLVRRGVAAQRIEAKGFGSSRPVASNATGPGRERNRRVEFVVP